MITSIVKMSYLFTKMAHQNNTLFHQNFPFLVELKKIGHFFGEFGIFSITLVTLYCVDYGIFKFTLVEKLHPIFKRYTTI